MTKKVGSDEGITRYAYDGMDRLTHVEYPDGRVVDYSFDDLGNRARMVEVRDQEGRSMAQTTYMYDRGTRLLTAEAVTGGKRVVTRLDYDPNGNQVRKDVLTYDTALEIPYFGLTPAGVSSGYRSTSGRLRQLAAPTPIWTCSSLL